MSQANRRSVAGAGGVGDVIEDTVPVVDGQSVLYNGVTGKHIKGGEDFYVSGTGQTIGAVTDDVVTVSLGATAGAYYVQVRVVGFESATPSSCNYQLDGGVRTTGAAATLIGQSQEFDSEAALDLTDVSLIVSGNDLIVRATGIAGLTVDWTCVLQYILQT